MVLCAAVPRLAVATSTQVTTLPQAKESWVESNQEQEHHCWNGTDDQPVAPGIQVLVFGAMSITLLSLEAFFHTVSQRNVDGKLLFPAFDNAAQCEEEESDTGKHVFD